MSEGFRHIIRISGVDIDGSSKLAYGLSKIRGVGINFAKVAVNAAGLSQDVRVGILTDDDVQKLQSIITHPEKYKIPNYLYNRRRDVESGSDMHLQGSELELRTKLDLDFMKEIRNWRGIRHALGLKVRGQRTRTSGRSNRAVGVKKKAIIAKAGVGAGEKK